MYADPISSSSSYRANAFAPQTGSTVYTGDLSITAEHVHFQSGPLKGSLPMAGMRLTGALGMGAMENSLALLNTHPTSQERIDRLEEKWNRLEEKSGFIDLGRWNQP